jgi:hypothetical protein
METLVAAAEGIWLLRYYKSKTIHEYRLPIMHSKTKIGVPHCGQWFFTRMGICSATVRRDGIPILAFTW